MINRKVKFPSKEGVWKQEPIVKKWLFFKWNSVKPIYYEKIIVETGTLLEIRTMRFGNYDENIAIIELYDGSISEGPIREVQFVK